MFIIGYKEFIVGQTVAEDDHTAFVGNAEVAETIPRDLLSGITKKKMSVDNLSPLSTLILGAGVGDLSSRPKEKKPPI